ncbi:MMPL family transporter [Mycobacterium sp. CBMA293]|uniref:MMPL/RND family transporter n=2 Tax=Mycolicibacterium TaxID=1866885 RepID=UPI0012DF190B|nr:MULTISPECIES: MMPL family transporter [unclassified Mycolicibacterium]MUL46748.1 MMPL family transporter [Mycolicibacterium sp. CBMA 360]MUL57468.1 MMPL family transporter [Mycolicibacterium sp. CBMA 335]MUL70508.1 MMPL family transporter [Mycolicibacterium sp. CBMA 311]MUL92556.1 MMPL family transporter [Mycolicibacterium sp. CBMA 230]MUM04932.1 MMPL family RND transporter [Mycolicibacterium sp. CBMA 213]
MSANRVPDFIRRYSVLIAFFWLGLAVVTNVFVPQLETVAESHNVSLSPKDAPSLQAAKQIGKVFHEFDSDSSAMIVLEGDQPLGAVAHHYYDGLIDKLTSDTKHVQHIQNFWGDPLTAAGSQSADGKAALVQVYLAGNQGESLANESVDAVRKIIENTPPPPGLKVYLTGAAPLITDQFEVGRHGTLKTTLITIGVIMVMLFSLYRRFTTVIMVIFTVMMELTASRGVVASLANAGIIELSTYSTNLLTLLVIAAGTDYAIFILGRFHEARYAGQDRITAYTTMYHGTAHIILGSGLTIAGAVFCLTFTRLPYFQSLGIPAGAGVLVAVIAALTLAPALLCIGRHFGLFEPVRRLQTQGWRRIGTAIVRWPGPILVVTVGVALIGLIALPGYRTSYDTRPYMPANAPANIGYAAAERHFSQARLNPELLMVQADHDLRNSTDMILLERVAKAVFHTDGIAQVQSITRPLGTPLDHSSIPFLISAGNSGQINNLPFQQARSADLLKQVDVINKSIDILRQQYALQQQSGALTHEQAKAFQDTVATTNDLRNKIADFDDFFRPIRNYFYWEPHCFDIPICAALRSVFDSLDGIDALSDQLGDVSGSISKLDALQPKLLALIPPQIASQEQNRDLTMTNYATNKGLNDQAAASLQNATALGQAYDASKTDDSFYLPPEAFTNPEFQRGMKLFMSPDGKAARMIITHDGDPATPEGISHIAAIRHAAQQAVKGTPLGGSKIYLAGTAATYKDIQEGAKYDLMIAGIAALSLILLVMMFITRSIVAALVIVGTVALSLGASFGLSVLIWQEIFGIDLYWIVLALAVILLLAVGSDYNLLLISRFKEEIHAGINTGIIRSMAGSGAVVTSAGLVFAATMASFVFADLRVLGQIGTTIALGLLFDTLIVRSFMTPSIAVLLGRWFWWPLRVRPRPASQMLQPYGSRASVRQLLLWEDDDPAVSGSSAHSSK